MPELICIGETMALVTPVELPLASARTATIGLAGAESNVAVQVARAGHPTAWFSRLGRDPLGERVAAEIAARGVDVRVDWDAAAPTGVMFKDPGVESSRVFYYRSGSAASKMNPGFVGRADLEGVRIVHTTGITPALSQSCMEMTEQLFIDARAVDAIVSFDVNDRRALWSIEDAAVTLTRFANAADMVLVGRDEAERLWGTATPDEIRAHLPHPHVLVVKDGEIGATAYVANDEPVFVAAPVVDVVEPVGAGDAFASGFLAATLAGLPIAERLAAGHAAAAIVLGMPHDIPPLEA